MKAVAFVILVGWVLILCYVSIKIHTVALKTGSLCSTATDCADMLR